MVMVFLEEKPSFDDASCCIVEVLKGRLEFRFLLVSAFFDKRKFLSSLAMISSASLILLILAFLPPILAREAVITEH